MKFEHDIFMKIYEHPNKYLHGEISLNKMITFTAGYFTYLDLYNKPSSYWENCLACDKNYKWNEFIQKKYMKNKHLVTLSSYEIISFFSKNEEEAFYNYFNDWEEFENSYVDDLTELNKLTPDELVVLEKNFSEHDNGKAEYTIKNLNKLIEHLEKRPAMYLSDKSLKKLGLFLEGYAVCRNELDEKNFTELEEFQTFVEEEYKEYLTNLKTQKSYVEIISLFSFGDESALQQFFVLFEKFTKTREIS